MICKHCQQLEATESRGLCHRCYKNKLIRALYPSKAKPRQPEPSQEELDQIISEQEKKPLPKTYRERRKKPKPEPRLGRTYTDWVARGNGWFRGFGYHE